MGVEKATEMAREPERVITLNEASRILSVSYNTTLRLVQSGELKAFRIRNAWRTSTTACENYILDLCGMSNPTEYALVDDKTGDVICYANTLQGLKETRAAKRCSDEIITLDDYQNIFGRRPWGDYE